jgi:hypothetical protein
MRIKNTNTLPKLVADGVYCADLICVSCEKKEAVGFVLESVKHYSDGKMR